MNPLIQFKNTTILPVLIALMLGCFALSPQARAACLDGCNNSLFNVFEGDDALLNNTNGSGNTALGWRSLFSNTDASFSTAVGGGALVLNNGDSNIAVGAAALLLNTTGSNNTAVGTDAMVFNDSGFDCTAVGYFALMNQTNGILNTAVGALAGFNYTGGETGNIVIGALSRIKGFVGVAGDNNTIRIGDNLLPTDFPTPQCFIGGVAAFPQVWDGITVCQVTVDFVGHLGVDCLNPDNPRAVPVAPGTPSAAGAHRQNNAMLNDKVEKLEASNAELRPMVAQQAKAMEVLTTQLKEQAAQIQKVSAQLELSKSAPRVVNNP
jgi:hypothetical protein